MTTAAAEQAFAAASGALRRLRTRVDAFGARSVGVRGRIVLAHVGMLAAAVVASVLVAREIVLTRLEERLDAELAQEVSEFRRLATSVDPRTGEPFGNDVRRVFEVFLQRNVPSRNEVFVTLVDGLPFLRSGGATIPYRLDRDGELVARWAALDRSARGVTTTPAGRVRFLATPVEAHGRVAGTFVVATFWDREAQELDEAVTAIGVVGGVLLLIGSLLAWRVAAGVLGPVRDVTATARSISASSLGRRIPTRGNDEIAQLAETFNEMVERLELAFESQRRFLDDAGHELRTPLTIVRGHLELMEGDAASCRRTAALLLDEVERMTRMVDDLTLLARSDRPDFLKLELVDVAVLTSDVVEKVRALGPRSWLVDSVGRGIIVADPHRLTQAVEQLAQNAVQHTDDGAPISLGSRVSGAQAHFWVRDSGAGVPPEDRARIFARFERGASATRESAGLGLAIVAAIARAHGGRVVLADDSGGGAKFTISVPVDRPAAAEIAG